MNIQTTIPASGKSPQQNAREKENRLKMYEARTSIISYWTMVMAKAGKPS